ncbi:ribonuclease III [bacterium]|nr:ribonuclease III [bacterium]
MIKETIVDDIYSPKPTKKQKKVKITYDDFCEILNYRFKKVILLKRALTHSSFTKNRLENNQRLEFLGDRVLGLSIATILYENYPLEDEGSLAIRHSTLVSTKALAGIADKVRIADLLELSPQELKRKGYKNKNILADSMEALLGAIYLDSGFEAAFKIIQRLWAENIEKSKTPLKDSKSKLQEYTQKKTNTHPTYTLLEKIGPSHSPTFKVTCTVEDITEISEGPSKRDAEQFTAAKILRKLNLLNEEELEDLKLYEESIQKEKEETKETKDIVVEPIVF